MNFLENRQQWGNKKIFIDNPEICWYVRFVLGIFISIDVGDIKAWHFNSIKKNSDWWPMLTQRLYPNIGYQKLTATKHRNFARSQTFSTEYYGWLSIDDHNIHCNVCLEEIGSWLEFVEFVELISSNLVVFLNNPMFVSLCH